MSQSYLFAYSLKHLQDYSEEFGSLTKISKQFKTKLYESFLKQEVEALGQYFTPRVIVQAVIRIVFCGELMETLILVRFLRGGSMSQQTIVV